MKILVTGATGFIGNHIIENLLKKNAQIIATSSNKQKAQSFSWFQKVEYLPFAFEDFNSEVNYFNFFNTPDILIHLAWQGLPNYKSNIHIEINLPIQFSFLQNMVGNGLSDLTVTGTCFEYGMQEGKLIETMPAKPTNPYASAKDKLRKKLEDLEQINPFNFKWIRLFYMYGSGQNPNSLLQQLERALDNNDEVFNMSGGEQIRDFLPIDYVAECITTIALQNDVEGIINCCSGSPMSIKNLVENYLREKKKQIKLNLGYYPYPDYEPMSFWGDTGKLNGILNK